MAFFHLPGAKNRVSARRAYTAARKTASREELLEGLRRYNENAVMKGEIIPAGTREITKVNVGEVAAYIACSRGSVRRSLRDLCTKCSSRLDERSLQQTQAGLGWRVGADACCPRMPAPINT